MKEREACEVPATEPGVRELFRFAMGVFGLYLAGPVLSLVDSAFVGRMSGTVQLAALGPGTAVCDSATYMLTCVGVATTNLYASRRARGQRVACRRVASDALTIGLIAGAILGLVLGGSSRQILHVFGTQANVTEHAISYMRIRALATPLALVLSVAQSICLGDRDSVTPVLVVGITAVVNFVGDMLLVPGYGVAGAALATAASQGVGAAFLLWVLRRRATGLSNCSVGPFGMDSGPGPLISWPSRKSAARFAALAVPVLVALFGKILFINSLTIGAAFGGTLALAAQQIAINQFFLFCKAGDSLNSTAQAYLPSAMLQRDSGPSARLLKKLTVLSIVWGVVNAAACTLLPMFVGDLFTKDAAVLQLVKSLGLQLAVSLLLHCFTLMLEGVLLSTSRGQWLAKTYWVNTLVFVPTLILCCRAFGSLGVVWWGLAIFNCIRLFQFSWRVRRDRQLAVQR